MKNIKNKYVEHKPMTVKEQIEKIPISGDYFANRYDTDNTLTLHIWDNEGNSYDIIVPKEEN